LLKERWVTKEDADKIVREAEQSDVLVNRKT
jgi:hypothetical protein